MTTEVPTRIRQIVMDREQGRCLRCAGRASQYAHRRTRAVVDVHQHCPCNGAHLCHTCHQVWAHANPVEAMSSGFMVSRHVTAPGSIPVVTWYGRLFLLCDGDIEFFVEGVHDGQVGSGS